jgi:hypothetical protein
MDIENTLAFLRAAEKLKTTHGVSRVRMLTNVGTS